jgi:hypothetical protein
VTDFLSPYDTLNQQRVLPVDAEALWRSARLGPQVAF